MTRMEPIGVIRTPYTRQEEIPIQGRFQPAAEGRVELAPAYRPGLADLAGFSHAWLLYHLHRSDRVEVRGRPYLEDRPKGIFAIRSPHRPNHIGLSVVRISRIEEGLLHFTWVDMLDGTPLLDIKPYVPPFDIVPEATSGWLSAHFESGST